MKRLRLPSKKRGFASIGDLLILILLFIISSLLGSLLTRWAGCPMPETVDGEIIYPTDWDFSTFVSYLAQMTIMISLTLLYRRLRRSRSPIARFSLRGLNPLLILGGIVVMISMGIVIEPLLGIVDAQQLPMPVPGEGAWSILSVVVLAPICEELLCRGILLEGLRTRYGITAALLGSSFFFAIIHLHPVMVINAFVLGLLFAILTLRTQSLWPSILLHALNNGLALLLMWAEFPGERFDGRPMSELSVSEMFSNPTTYRIVYIVAALICLRAIVVSLRHLHRIGLDHALREDLESSSEAKNEEETK